MDVSVIIDNGRPWAEIRELALAAEELGVHAIYVCDHFMEHHDDDTTGDEPFLECGTLLAGLAEATSRARLGALVMGSTYRHPAVVANMVTTIDHISGGRAIAGLGAGWQVNEHLAYGIDLLPPADLSDRFEETVAVVRSLLRAGAHDLRGRALPADRRAQQAGARAGAVAGPGRPAAARGARCRPRRGTPTSGTSGAGRGRSRPRAPSSTRPARRSDRDPARSGGPPASPTPVGTDVREALEPYREVCDEFVVFDWTDRPLQSTVDDLTAALAVGPA